MNQLSWFLEKHELFSSIYPANIDANMNIKTLEKTIDNYKIILELALEALHHLQEGHLTLFDALVGENACQIRAYMICDLFNIKDLKSRLKDLILKVDEIKIILNTHDVKNLIKNLGKVENKEVSLKKILKKNQLDIEVPRFVTFTILAYILTITKSSSFNFRRIKIEENIELIIKEDNQQKSLAKIRKATTNTFSDKLTKLARKKLSDDSVSYVQDEADLLGEANLIAFVHNEYVKSNRVGLSSLPCYISTDILLKRGISKKVPIIINIQMLNIVEANLGDYLTILYTPDSQKQNYIASDISVNTSNSAAIVMEAFATDNNLTKESLRNLVTTNNLVNDIVLPFFTTHHQYPDLSEDKTSYLFMDSKYEELKSKAFELGVCKSKPKLCCFYHIYADTIQQQACHKQSFLARAQS